MMNFASVGNSCNCNDALPVTVPFAGMVGEVVAMGCAKGAEKQPFKFYVWRSVAWAG